MRTACAPWLLLRPKYLAAYHRWQNGTISGKLRAVVILLITITLAISIYCGSYAILSKLQASSSVLYVQPELILTIFLLGLFCLVLFSSSIHMVGSLYFSADLDLTLAAPISKLTLFLGKFIDAMIQSSWMALVFVIPIVLAFGVHAGGSLLFYAAGLATIVPFFIIPVAIAMSMVLMFAFALPASFGKFLVVSLSLVGGALCIWFTQSLLPASLQPWTSGTVLGTVSALYHVDSSWLPPTWVAHTLISGLSGNSERLLLHLGLLYGSATALGSFAFIVLHVCHRTGYAKTRHAGKVASRQSHSAVPGAHRLLKLLPGDVRAILLKEFRLFARDLTQAMQLLLLIGLCLVYLYNFGSVRHTKQLSPGSEVWWDALLVLCNTILGAFVMAALCSRFVFPSLSLEGQNLWILQKSPLSIRRLMRIKFFVWLVPIALISSVILAAGAFAIDAEPRIVVASVLMSWLMSYGLVGLAIGLGASYANFQWEQATQLTASIGNFVYLILSAGLICINAIPLAVIISLRAMKLSGIVYAPLVWYPIIICSAGLLALINFGVTWAAMRSGLKRF